MLEAREVQAQRAGIQVLWDVSLKVNEAEIVALVGPNGAGKSTILQVVSGLIRPTGGRVLFQGRSLSAVRASRIVARGLCHVPEGRGLFPQMTVRENLEMGCYLGPARTRRDESFRMVYEYFPRLGQRAAQRAGTLSGGEQQMLAIGRGIMSRPKLLILDEPSWGLAPLLARAIFDVIRRINAAGVAILLVEQNVHMALELAHRAYVLENGRIAGHGAGAELLADDHIKEAYLGQAPASPPAGSER
ncbi:MAG: ABC transporter ATP-binding protein [Proteobacteria bacterium]|nr:ABC transporter ATP-binding protein [Pseudomonadota bacterium]